MMTESVIDGKVIHFYPNKIPSGVWIRYSWDATAAAIAAGIEVIHTTQMGALSTKLIDAGYSIVIHDDDGLTTFEVVDGAEYKYLKSNKTDREMRFAVNLFNLWKGGEFTSRRN